ncbi:MAG: amidohydrolase [Chitinophagaceae bacterium]
MLLLWQTNSWAQKPSPELTLKNNVITALDENYATYKEVAFSIWEYAELGYQEHQSTAILQQTLKNAGFTITNNVAGIPTAFVATYGSGSPVIGILAEFDALPGLSQKAVPVKESAGKKAGHGCGHHLFGTASVAAGIAIKEFIEKGQLKGTVKVYGCPAEEGGSGKVYMVREKLFEGVDAVIHWHPGDAQRGRSALDGVEGMNYLVNMMREHIPSDARIHYVITNGGKAPNVVPDFAEVYYYVRHPKREEVVQLFDRVVKAAEGAAIGTETKMDYEIIGGTHDLLLNKTLAVVMEQNLQKVGGVKYTEAETSFAVELQKTFGFAVPPISSAATVAPMKQEMDAGGGSTDVGDVSYVVPTVGLRAATWVPGTPAHSWQAVACGGTEIGTKGMMVAAKTMALTAIDLMQKPAIIEKAKQEWKQMIGNYQYKALLGDRKPALDYRN